MVGDSEVEVVFRSIPTARKIFRWYGTWRNAKEYPQQVITWVGGAEISKCFFEQLA